MLNRKLPPWLALVALFFFFAATTRAQDESLPELIRRVKPSVVSVITFENEDDLIKQANEVAYGLSAGIWTKDITRAHRFAKAVKAGTVWINTYNMFNAASPFGGYKQSGYGREMGKHALEMYTQVKSVWVDLSGKPIGWFGN